MSGISNLKSAIRKKSCFRINLLSKLLSQPVLRILNINVIQWVNKDLNSKYSKILNAICLLNKSNFYAQGFFEGRQISDYFQFNTQIFIKFMQHINIFKAKQTMSLPISSSLPRPTKTSANPLVNMENLNKGQVMTSSNFNVCSETPKGNILHIGNICPDVLFCLTQLTYQQIKQGLYNLFSKYGPIYEILIKTKDSGQHFAFVDFPDIRDTEKAYKSAKNESMILAGRELIVNYCSDPKKNHDRKDQKCFLCHGTGHKAIKCPVKPDLIKPKIKKQYCQEDKDEETHSIQDQRKGKEPITTYSDISDRSEPSSSQDQSEIPKRDRDYLRFLNLKKALLQKKLDKKIRKDKKKKRS